MKLLAPLSALLVSFSFTAYAQSEPVLMRLNLPENEPIDMVMDMKISIFTDSTLTDQMMKQHINMVQSFVVDSTTPEEVHHISLGVEKIYLEQEMYGEKNIYDSDNPDLSDPVAAALDQQFGSLLNEPMKLKIDERGQLLEEPEGSLQATGVSGFENLFIKFPVEPVAVGDTWEDEQSLNSGGREVDFIMLYEVEEITTERISLQAKVKPGSFAISGDDIPVMDLQQKGSFVFDVKTGQVLLMKTNQLLKMQSPEANELFMINELEYKAVEN